MQRQSVAEPMQTGLKPLMPSYQLVGQRELVIGDRKTGKHRLQLIQLLTKKDKM